MKNTLHFLKGSLLIKILSCSIIMMCSAFAEVVDCGPGVDLQKVLNKGHDIALRKSCVYPVSKTLRFRKPNQRIFTKNAKRLSDYAELKIVNPEISCAVDGCRRSGVRLENLLINGNRYQGQIGRDLPSYKRALVFLGGKGAVAQVIKSCVLVNTKSWSTIKVHEGGERIVVENNIIIGAGADCRGNGKASQESPFAWGDGVSCAAKHSSINNNLILDPTDVGVVVFGAPGSEVKDNVVATISRESLGGINLVDALVWEIEEGSNRWDYRDTVVSHNLIDAYGARIHMGIPMGVASWSPGRMGNVLVGAEVCYNELSGSAAAYGMVARDIDKFNIHHNTSTAQYSGLADGVHRRPPEKPGAFYYEKGEVGDSLLQKDFKPAERHLLHLLRCNHGPKNDAGFRLYTYGKQELKAVIDAAYVEMLGRKPHVGELKKWSKVLLDSRGRSDRIREAIMESREFKRSVGDLGIENIQAYRTALWFELLNEVIAAQVANFSAKQVYGKVKLSLLNKDLRKKVKSKVLRGYHSALAVHPSGAVDTAMMTEKVMCGYQGWYRTPEDGSGLGWEHYETYEEDFVPGRCGVDYWPDMSELDEDEMYKTAFRHKGGQVATVFSSQNPKTVERHFKWMKEADIDGVFLQRFAADVVGYHHQTDLLKPSNNEVLKNVQAGSHAHGRSFSIMYDLSGMPKGQMGKVMADWKELIDSFALTEDPHYQGHHGKPVVAIWGVGFNDNRAYTLKDVGLLMDFLKNDPVYGGCSILLGIPTYWRTMDRDSVDDPRFHELLKTADVILPWSVGRFGGSHAAKRHGEKVFSGDVKWCEANGVDYLPVAFPGFSWGNRYKHKNAKYDHIPREGGRFLWAQLAAAKRSGAKMAYVAMFDEMDEGTQIFKVAKNVPIGESPLLSYGDLPSDFYLRLTGEGGKLFRSEISCDGDLPEACVGLD